MHGQDEHFPVGEVRGRYRMMNGACGSGRKRPASRRAAVLLALSLILCFAVAAEAGMVYGRVFGDPGVFRPGDTFVLMKKDRVVREVKTDESGGYSIIIKPGIYRVLFKAEDGTLWEAWIKSFSVPARQDIHLKRK
ncbi:MAG: hypothetical protein GXO94_04625 [Nitrospirae bacterium]|nr:hypothetical protein [Nitrospirota bacterium]